MSLLKVSNLSVVDNKTKDNIVSGVNFKLDENMCLGIVGESGSGKSLSAKAILGLLSPNLKASGSVEFKGNDLLKADRETLRKTRGQKICMVLQDAISSFDPLYTIGYQMIETLVENKGVSKSEAREIAIGALNKVRINDPEQVVKKYAHQLSGGMLQRCMIATALCMKPEIIIADEPTTALDSINQREVVEELKKLTKEYGTSLIFISHDLGIVQYLADEILVMKDGNPVEYGDSEQIFKNPQSEYTKYLISTRVELTQKFNESMLSLVDEGDAIC